VRGSGGYTSQIRAEHEEAAGVADAPKGWLFIGAWARSGELTENPLSQADVYRMICRRHPHADQQSHVAGHRHNRVPG
jgi:hypothetical protein